jgi:hypothetical protein
MNSVGVRKYSSWEQGIEATAETLLGGKGRYSNIITALQERLQASDKIFHAVTSSPWGTHHIGNVSTDSYGVTRPRRQGGPPAGRVKRPAAATPRTTWLPRSASRRRSSTPTRR